MQALDFEKSVIELESKISELRNISGENRINVAEEVDKLQSKANRQLQALYGRLTPVQKVQIARHPERPHYTDYIKGLIKDFTPLAGDRLFGEDYALFGGLGRFQGRSCVVLGQEKGSDTDSRLRHNFGMARPEGYRKAQRLIKMAAQYKIPVLTFVDTAGAYPGLGAEERGQSEAIAKSIETCLRSPVPIISTIIGEGGSGGAIAIATADRVFMLEHSIYSVISPEGCASILWRSAAHAADAASALKLTAQDLKELKLIDSIVAEPLGGAHRNPAKTIDSIGTTIARALTELDGVSPDKLISDRRKKFLKMGRNIE